MKEIRADIDINASAEQVWRILTDFRLYPEWNPFIKGISGEAKTGREIEVRVAPPGGKAATWRPRVLRAAAREELRWLNRLLIPGLFDAEHALRIERVGDSKVHFVQQETISGILVPLMGKALEARQRGFEAMNAALKARAEAQPGTGGR